MSIPSMIVLNSSTGGFPSKKRTHEQQTCNQQSTQKNSGPTYVVAQIQYAKK